MNTEEKQLLSSILTTLNQVAYQSLIELRQSQYANPNLIKELKDNKDSLDELIQKFRDA